MTVDMYVLSIDMLLKQSIDDMRKTMRELTAIAVLRTAKGPGATFGESDSRQSIILSLQYQSGSIWWF